MNIEDLLSECQLDHSFFTGHIVRTNYYKNIFAELSKMKREDAFKVFQQKRKEFHMSKNAICSLIEEICAKNKDINSYDLYDEITKKTGYWNMLVKSIGKKYINKKKISINYENTGNTPQKKELISLLGNTKSKN